MTIRWRPTACLSLSLILPLMAGVVSLSVSNAPAAKSNAKDAFDLSERKQRQPWLWQAPAAGPVPAVRQTNWPASAEDRFILHGLETAGLAPAPDAPARTWLRRVHFVITGLPPTQSEIAAFLADREPGARERVVDRLLERSALDALAIAGKAGQVTTGFTKTLEVQGVGYRAVLQGSKPAIAKDATERTRPTIGLPRPGMHPRPDLVRRQS